jgi:hypothetical protein
MWDKIKNAVQSVSEGEAKRIDGEGWTVYAVGSNVIRIDLKRTG